MQEITQNVVSSLDWNSLIAALTNQISVSTVVGVLTSGATAAVGFVFLWWGARKAVGMLMSAFKRGRLRV